MLALDKNFKQFASRKEIKNWSRHMAKALDPGRKWKPGWKGKLILVCYSGPENGKEFQKYFIEVLAPANGALLKMMQHLTDLALEGEESKLERAWNEAADHYARLWGDRKPGVTSTDGEFCIKDWQDVKTTLQKKVRSLVVVLGGESGGRGAMACIPVCVCLWIMVVAGQETGAPSFIITTQPPTPHPPLPLGTRSSRIRSHT